MGAGVGLYLCSSENLARYWSQRQYGCYPVAFNRHTWINDTYASGRGLSHLSGARQDLPPASGTAASSAIVPSLSSSSSAGPMPVEKAKAKAKPPTVSSQEADGKKVVSGVLSGSHNSVHAVLRLMCSHERSGISRSIVDLSEPLHDEHSHSASQVKDVDTSVDYYVDAANFSWLAAALVFCFGKFEILFFAIPLISQEGILARLSSPPAPQPLDVILCVVTACCALDCV